MMTGSRGTGVDRRRVRGAHRGLKKILVEGMTNGGEHPKPWKDFSGAMVRQAVNEAMNQLPPDHKEVVKLAYFGGLSNREIAQDLGLSVGGVQRRLRLALARVSDHIEHGRVAGRRAFMALLGLLAARQLIHAFKLATVTVAVSVIAVQPAPSLVQAVPRTHAPVVATNDTKHPSTLVSANAPGHSAMAPAPTVTEILPVLPVKVPPLPTPPVPAPPKLP
jgi:predicted DNA-binding protein (UPF0251 family)